MFLQILLHLAQEIPVDGGPIYAETDLSKIVAEPWNAYSSLTFLLPVIYWFFKLRNHYKEYPFLMACMPLLTLGGIGSTIYHAFRNSEFFLLMDVMPIALLTFLVILYFWWKVLDQWVYVALIAIAYITVRIFIYQIAFGQQTILNLSYFVTGVMMFVPAFLLLLKTNYKGVMIISIASAFFVLSLIFRQVDSPFIYLPMGTHWLWHVSCAIGAYFLGQYLYLVAHVQTQNINA